MGNNLRCFFCESPEIKLSRVGIVPIMAIGGDEYSFCGDCLQHMTAEEFWEEFFVQHGYNWPPPLE